MKKTFKKNNVRAGLSSALFTFALALAAAGQEPIAANTNSNPVNVSEKSGTIPPYQVFEITLSCDRTYPNPFTDAACEAVFTSPSGEVFSVGGFFYGSSDKPASDKGQTAGKANIWKVRFAPNRAGDWKYTYTFNDKTDFTASGAGGFRCVPDRVARRGFVRRHPENAFQWVFDDGAPFYPIGLQDGIGYAEGVDSVLTAMCLEGPFRKERKNRPDPPPGAMFQPGPAMNPVNAEVYFRRYARCGFNLFRHPGHNAPSFGAPDRPDARNGAATDELLLCVRKYGYGILFCMFGWDGAWKIKPENAEGMEKTKRFAKYIVDRWGAYVDFWEFYNEESSVPPAWYEIMTPYVKSIDPYHHPITTSFPRAEVRCLDFESPHHYSSPNVLDADASLASAARWWRKPGKPVIVGEFGNSADVDFNKRAPGVGGVWDPDSAVRMRIRNWTALGNECSIVFWNTSYAKDGHFMNIWLGPREREYVMAMQDFAYRVGKDARMSVVGVSDLKQARGYGLASKERSGAYLHHFKDHDTPLSGLVVAVEMPKTTEKLHGYWYSPENAAILGRFDPSEGEPCEDDELQEHRVFTVPDFIIDIALLITPDGPPDIDHDGLANDEDLDDDNDKVPDDKDAFPLEPEEWADADGDLIGDNLDADWDPADGIGDDHNGNGAPDCAEMDIDGDGVPRANVAPWDAFPFDAKEWSDMDGDGIGDNSDPDIDGDGFTNGEEKKAGTAPSNQLSFPPGN